MNIIIPMAGLGKRMRPHTLSVPKPLIPVAGKPIVQRLVEDIVKVCSEKIDEIAFIVHPNFGYDTEQNLKAIAKKFGAKGVICYQEKALGIAHAIYTAQSTLKGNVIIALADTLFKPDFILDTNNDGVICVSKVDDPRSFGVVKTGAHGYITEFYEKPETFVSDLAIIGIYYIKDGAMLKQEIEHVLNNNIKEKGEYQLTTVLENMKNKGTRFTPGIVPEWLDCGNKTVTVHTNQRVLEFVGDRKLIHKTVKLVNSQIIQPCFIGENTVIENSVIGPYVSIGEDSKIDCCIISNSIIQANTKITKANIENSMIGNHVVFEGRIYDLNVGDYSHVY